MNKLKQINISKEMFNNIKNGKITQIILEDNLESKEEITFNSDDDKMVVEITAKAKYNSLDDCLKIIPIDLFGIASIDDAKRKYLNFNQINVYRVKCNSDIVEEIDDKDLLKLIDEKTLKKNNIGHSSVNVYEVKLKNGKDSILKIQHLSSRNNLVDEYERIEWLQGKCNVPKIYYCNEKNNVKYLLMEKKEGVSAHKTNDYAFKIGKILRQIHDIDISKCKFNQNDVDNLLKNALKNIDIICSQVQETYPEMSKDDIIYFLKNNKPSDKVLVHGDYSLPNILINNDGEVGIIDLGDVSISTKYFDFFYLKKSMIRNKQIDKLEELLNGYGIDKLDDNYMKWIEIVDKALF